jgi:hypothetical protein
MADDRGLEGPEDARLVEAPTGLTPLELRAGEEARRKMLEHLGNRPVLNMDQLVEMTDLRPRLEKEVKLPGDARGSRNRIYFFSIDGTLRGNRFNGLPLRRRVHHGAVARRASSTRCARRRTGCGDDGARDRVLRRDQPLGGGGEPAGQQSHMNVDVGGRRASTAGPA